VKKNRSTLKDYFKKGAIPTESNFGDLIDSMLNQDEDSISKLPNDPLKIVATGADEALLNFYRLEQNEEKLSWQVKQKPRGKPGLNFGDEAASRLFIESGSGEIGIGTTAPEAKLQIQKADTGVFLRVGRGDTSGNEFTMDVASGQGLVSLVGGAKINPDGKGYTFLGTRGASKITLHDGRINFHTSDVTNGIAGADATGLGNTKMFLTNDGNLGLGAASIYNPQGWNKTLDVFGDNHARLNVRSSNVVTSVFSHDNWNGARGVIGTESNHPLTFATNYTHQMTLQTNGNLGIGTNDPGTFKLSVNGDLRANRYVVQDSVDGGSTKGIWMWNSGDSNWGIYMSTAGANKSLAGKTATDGDGFSSHSIRVRTYSDQSNGFIYENHKEQLNFSVRASDGYGYLRGPLRVAGGVLIIGDWTISSEGTNLFFKRGGSVVARLSTDNDRFLVFRNLNNAAPYFYFNKDGNTGVWNG